MRSLTALASDPRVAGVTPDRSGTVAGYKGKKDETADAKSVFASDHLGGGAGDNKTGQGVNVAMLDTGLSDTPALDRASGRVTDGVDVSQLDATGQARISGQFTDGYGHGTFLASLIAGGRVPGSGGHALGVAPAARVVVVKVANAQGETSLSEVLAGMDWVASHAQAPNGTQMIQVLNVALAVSRPTAPSYGADPLTAAVNHVRAAGVLVVAAGGNHRRRRRQRRQAFSGTVLWQWRRRRCAEAGRRRERRTCARPAVTELGDRTGQPGGLAGQRIVPRLRHQ
jgi:serine protease AprX